MIHGKARQQERHKALKEQDEHKLHIRHTDKPTAAGPPILSEEKSAVWEPQTAGLNSKQVRDSAACRPCTHLPEQADHPGVLANSQTKRR